VMCTLNEFEFIVAIYRGRTYMNLNSSTIRFRLEKVLNVRTG
jgi:hypothetical protein